MRLVGWGGGGALVARERLDDLRQRAGEPLGRDGSPFFAAPAMIHAAARATAPRVFAHQQNGYLEDGIDMSYVKDWARAVALLQTTDQLDHTTYNIAAGRATSNAELLATIRELLPDRDLTLPAGRDPNGPGQDTWLDITRLQNDTGYQPAYPAKRAVADYIAWLQAGNDR